MAECSVPLIQPEQIEGRGADGAEIVVIIKPFHGVGLAEANRGGRPRELGTRKGGKLLPVGVAGAPGLGRDRLIVKADE